jgi:hypothetical protein
LFAIVERVADVYEHDTGQLPQPGLLLRALQAAE